MTKQAQKSQKSRRTKAEKAKPTTTVEGGKSPTRQERGLQMPGSRTIHTHVDWSDGHPIYIEA